jgi:23S rRNA (guanosine2251-2'-O)-methyltransferase
MIKSEEKDDLAYIYGRNAVFEAIDAGGQFEKIFISFAAKGGPVDKIFAAAKRNSIPVAILDKRKFITLAKKIDCSQESNQGVIALLQAGETFTLDEIIEKIDLKTNPVLVVLDGITDPHNLGAIARSAECSGASALILPEHNSAPVTPVAVKTSAGALKHIPVVKVTNLSTALQRLKEEGYWVVGTEMNAPKAYFEEKYDKPLAVIIGSEGKGMRPSTKKQCDILIKIPMRGKIESLNASVSAGIILFEILKQRG